MTNMHMQAEVRKPPKYNKERLFAIIAASEKEAKIVDVQTKAVNKIAGSTAMAKLHSGPIARPCRNVNAQKTSVLRVVLDLSESHSR